MKKDLLIIFAIVLLFIVMISGTEIQSVEEYYLTHIDDITSDSKVVTLSINCSEVLENYDKLDENLRSEEFVPADGIILPPTKYVLREGDTVFDILDRAARKNKIQMEYQGADKNIFGTVYIEGINHLYEYSCGETSGWVYAVNGVFPDYGCSKYELSDGDVIEFIYTCSLGSVAGYNNPRGEESK